jgi:hypothetical protein
MYTEPMRRQTLWMVVLASLVVLAAGCAANYCQSGPKEGTRCYDAPGAQQSQPTGAYAAPKGTGTTSSQLPPATTQR